MQQSATQQKYMIQDLCSHRALIRQANEHYYGDKSPEHLDMIQNFEELVDKIKEILQEKVVYIEKTVMFNSEIITKLQDEVVQFIRDKILETTKLELVHPTSDLDEIIRENFMVKTRNRIHYKVLEYLYKATQILILDQQSTIRPENLVVLLRFMDCLTWDPSAIYEEVRGLSSLRLDHTKAIVELADQTQDLRVFKLAAAALSNAQNAKSWPTGTNNLFAKYLHLTEIGESLLLRQLEPDFSLSQTIESLQQNLTFQLDFIPSKASLDFNMFDFNEKWIQNGIEDAEKKDQNILSSISQENEVKSQQKTTINICVKIDLKTEISQISSQKMQISNETVTMKEVAEKIFDEQYTRKMQEVENALSLEKFKKKHPEYYRECLAYIEMRLILSASVKDEESFYLAIECSIQALKRVIQREDQYLYQPEKQFKFSQKMGTKVKNLDSKLTHLCIKIIMSEKAQNDEKFQSHCISILQALKQGLRKIKDTRSPNALGQSQSIKDFMGSDDDHSFLIDILSQISSLSSQPVSVLFKLSDSLLKNHRFQSQIWQVAQQVYEILSSIIRQHLPSVSADAQSKFLKQRKDIEVQAQKTLLNSVKEENGSILIIHNLDVLRLIVHTFIRSAWVLEGIVPNVDGQNSEDQNLLSLIDLTCKMVKSVEIDCFYLTQSGQIKVLTDDIVLVVHFLVRRLTVDNRGPNHPASYDQAILQSDLFKDEVFGKIMADPLEVPEGEQRPDRCAISKLKTAFISCLGAICSNDPAQIPKVIEKGLMSQVISSLQKTLPVHRRTFYVLLDFLRVLVVHEKGRSFIKESGLFELVMNPCTLNLTDSERKGDENDQNNMSYVIIASNQEKHKMHAHHAMSGLLRCTDPYFQDTAVEAVKKIIEFITPKAKALQKIYYDHMDYCSKNHLSKRRFQIEITDKLISNFDYHAIKFEVEKIHTLSQSMTQDAQSLINFNLKVFNKESLNDLFDFFEIISTIKPAYDFVQRGTAADRQGSPFFLFTQIFSTIIFRSDAGINPPGVDVFEQRLRSACKNLSDIFSELEKPTLKKIDLVEFLKVEEGGKILPEICQSNQALGKIDPKNLRGNLIASVLIVGQYITIFENTRKATQESLCVTKAWSSELSILSGFMTSFNECNHKITDEFFRNQQSFIDIGVVTKNQINEISIGYTKDLTQEQKEKFAENRKQIEENIDMHRENLTYLDPEFINIQRLLQIVWDYWRAPSNRNGRMVEGQIIESKQAYTELTIDNIKDLDPVIGDFERLRSNINSTEFLTTISRIYTYISELQQLIINEKLCGITFYEFVQSGCLSQLIKIFNIVKTISIKQHGKELDVSKQIKFIAVDCIQQINRQLKSVLTQFICCSPQLIAATAPTMPVLIKEAGLFDSPQHFFSNYVHNLVQQLVLEGPESDQPEQQVPLYEDKNLRQVQILLLNNVASGFDKCKYLKDEHGGSARDQAKEIVKIKKPHHDKEQITAITAMGFDEAVAKKALKAAGDVSNAVTLLLESSFNLDGVSDSEEEKEPTDEQIKAEEVEKQQAEVELDQKRQSLISVAQFKDFVKVAQDKGLKAVSDWSTFPTEQAKIIPLKAQRKYVDLYDQYIISLVRSPNQSQDDLTKVFDKIFSDYVKNVQKVVDSSSLNIDQITALYYDTKNKLSLLHRLTKIDNYESMLRSQRKDSLSKLIENVVKTVKAITSSQIRSGQTEKQNFYYISNAQELLYKSLLLLLSYLTILNSKKIKYENAIIENEKKAGEVTTKKAKLKSLHKKLEDLCAVKCAVECSKFQEKMASVRISKKYSKDLNILSGQIEDISRSILLQSDSDIKIPIVTNTMTSGTSTLNIIQIQKKAYNEQRIQSQIEDIIKKMLEVKARKIAQFNNKEAEITEIQQKDSLIDFKAFTAEFQAQVLGIGKGPVAQNQNRWGAQAANVQQYFSQPSNELANQHFTKIFRKAISTTCDLIVKQNKSQAQEELVKDQNIKETLTSSKIQLKAEIIDQVNKKIENIQPLSNDDTVIYKTFVDSLSKSTQPWFDELQSLKPCGLDSFENWKELSLLELRNLSSLARVYVDQESGILKEMIEGENILEWFRNVYLPLRLLNRKEEETEVQYELEQSATIESLDKNVCLFLNEITGYGHLYCDKAQEQRITIRNRLLTSCLESLQTQAQNPNGIKDLTVLEQAQIISCLMIIQHLTNQYNQFEYNRVLLSRSCYSESITMLFNFSSSQRFVQIINGILGQVIKIQGQNFSTVLIERTLKIFTTIALFLEGEKKRDRYVKETAKRQKELAKKKAEEKKKAEALADAPQPNAPVQAADDALMNAESEDDDDDIHGEGSLSQQQPLPEAEEPNEEEAHEYGEIDDQEDQDEDEDDMEDDEDAGVIIQQQVNMHEANALMVDEDEEEDELIAVEEHDEEGDEMDADDQEEDEFDDDADYDLPSPSEDLGMLFTGIGNRHRGGRPAAGARDILFTVPEAGAPGGDRMRIERPGRVGFGYDIRIGSIQRIGEPQNEFGPNWSQEEQEVSQTLRNLRGISNSAPEAPPRQALQQPPGRNSQQETCRYRIELEICKQFLDQQSTSALAKKSIEQIKLEQSKPQNNQISSMFEILKPIDLQGLGSLAQQIDQEFVKGMRSREDQIIEDEKALKKERQEKIKKGEQLNQEEIKAQEQLEDCNYADDEESDEAVVLSTSAASFYPQTGLFRDFGDDRGEPELSRLMDMRMDIERLLHAQIYDPAMPGSEDDPLGLESIFGVPPGYPPRQPARERERVNQANAQRVAREQAVNWASSIYRAPEISVIENTQNMMQGLIEGGNVVYDIVEQPEPVVDPQPLGSASSSLRSPSIPRSQEEAKNSQGASRIEQPLPHLRDINSVLADLQVGQISPNTQAIQGDGQNTLNSFFRSLNEGEQQPIAPPTQLFDPPLPSVVGGDEVLLGGMGGINQALDEINIEMQTDQEQPHQPADTEVNANLPEQPQPQPEPVQQDEPLGSALLDDEPYPEEAKQEPAQAQVEVEKTYGFPNSLLIENDIDPEMLHEFPEELRVEILSTIQDQLEQWERDHSPNQQQQQQQPVSEQPMSQDNTVPAQDQQAQPQPQPQPQPAEEEMDPEVAQAIAMGLDPDFIANIPPEMRRELIFNESFRAANTGAPIPPPTRAPEAMDVASIIATAQDPTLRREMLLSLSAEQIDQLPPALRGEAENLRRGRGGGGGGFGQNPGGIPRQPRNIEQMMMGGDREDLERQMGLFLNRYNRNYPEGDPIKKQAPDPKDMPFDILMIEYSFEMDQKLQDKALESEKLIDKIQSQMLSSDSTNIDQLLKHILTVICLNCNVKADIIQLLRLILKYKVDNGYPCRNQVVNALTFVMKISAQKDTQRLLDLFEIQVPENKKGTVIISDLQWNQIFLTVTGVLRVLIDNNKKLIMHMLKCLIQREDYFVSKGDHLVSSHASILLDDSEKIPPLAQIIQIMREQSEIHHTLSKKQNQSELEKVAISQYLVRIRNVKLLIQDAFKQFDNLFKEIDFAAKNGSPIINLGELSPESVKSLTDLLYLPSIDKKLLTALGDFMFRLSNLSDTAKCQEKNQRNWSMISKQCEIIGKTNVTDLNNLMLDALMTFGSFDVQNIDLNRVSSITERSVSQMSSGPNNQAIESKPITKKISPEQEKELKDFLTQFKMDSAPIKHILSLYSFFFTKFTEEKDKVEKKEPTEELKVIINQKDDFIKDIKQFFKSDEVSMLVTQINKMLIIVQQSGTDQIEHIKVLVNLVFDCFMPEMHDEVVKGQKPKDKRDSKEEEDSKYVSMEHIPKMVTEESDAVMEAESSSLVPIQQSTTGSKRSKKLIFRDVHDASTRLFQFNNFCVQNQQILNKLVKNIYGGQNQRERERESKSKDIATVSEYIKFMPNLLDFENKRIYFKKEIKKMKRNVNARSLVLMIRRNEIFMDSYSQLHYLGANEIMGKLSVEFSGERGQDVGGLTRDFFIELSREMFNQNYSLFKGSDNGSTYMPNPKSDVQPDHIRYFKFIGRVIGKALFEGCNLECYFVKSMYKMMIGQRLNFKDLEDYDNNLYTGLNWCLQPSSDVETLYETFSTQLDFFGRTEEIDLIKGGRDIDVTNENKEYYVERKAYFHLYKSVQKQMDAFLEGFYEIIPQDLVSIFTYKELELLISGLPDYQISDLRAHTNYNGYNRNSPQIVWFWEIMEAFDREEKGNLLQFVTGSSKVPVEGFALLQGMNGPENFQITRIIANDSMRLPQGHTCFNQLDLPEYASKEIMKERLMWAIKETAGFGFA